MLVVTPPGGTATVLGNFTSDYTGGTYTHYIPSQVGNYTFQMFYGGQTLTGIGETEIADLEGISWDPDQQHSYTGSAASAGRRHPDYSASKLMVADTSQLKQRPNLVLNHRTWLGLAANAFGATGAYNDSGNENPYTMGPITGHILWTKPWCVGGVAGGDAGGTEQAGSYWTTSQYEPKWEPVVIDGILYSTWYTTDTNYNAGIVATNLYNGQTMFTINTSNALLGGMQPFYETPNQYGVVGPYIITSGTLPGVVDSPGGGEYNLYDALTGMYVCSIVNGTTQH